MKIAIIGNCQCESFAAWVRYAISGAEAKAIHVQHLHDPDHESYVVTALQEADIVASQGVEWPRDGKVRAAIIAAQPKTKMWPGFGFDGFHPDTVYLFNPSGGLIRSAMGDYNSRIIAAAFVAKRTPTQTHMLFNSLSYARLGYFDAYPNARAAVLAWLGQHGLDAEPMLVKWLAPGPFMHTVNHPAIRVIGDIARHVMQEAGLDVPPENTSFPDDPFAGCTWPIYPEIGQRIGIEGSMNFVPGQIDGKSRIMLLEEMIEKSFEVYSALPSGIIEDIAEIKNAIDKLKL